jgi:hypothetical protein
MKKCASCGRESMDSARFCESCGSKFEELKQEETTSYVTYENAPIYESAPLPEVTTTIYTSSKTTFESTEAGSPPPNTGMVWLILSSVMAFLGCICYGLGILQTPSIIFGAISVSKHSKGDYEGAKKASKISMILFFSILGLSILLIVLVAVSFASIMGVSEIGEIVDEFY